MSAAEIGGRVQDRVNQAVWARRFGLGWSAVPARGGPVASHPLAPPLRRAPTLPPRCDAALTELPDATRRSLLATADGLLEGRVELLGATRKDMVDPDWAWDPVSGRRFPSRRCAFRIDCRDPRDSRHVKQVWELSRHQHLTVLALAWRLSGDERYAAMVSRHLRSWWAANPVLDGVNWASGIELGVRLISWAWTRRLLDGWQGASALFEESPVAVDQLYWHQRYLATFRSRGSSANNHVVAEAAGLLVGACAFPWYPESPRWRREAGALLEEELARNTFPSGLDREQAFEYHGFVAELGLVAAAEAAAAGAPLSPRTGALLRRMVDAVAAVLDGAGRPPRYGDGDDGRALILAAPGADRWASLLALGAAVFDPLPWWPGTVPDASSLLVAGLAAERGGVSAAGAGRPARRPDHFPDAGVTILRAPTAGGELWCRCDGGPHGYLSIAAHGHADALSLELRHDGVELLVDPGTYCYQGDPFWRRYFRSTIAHNTLELDGLDQSEPGGPFLWTHAAQTRLLEVVVEGPGPLRWSAEHDGYGRLAAPALHRRTVEVDPGAGTLTVRDCCTAEGVHDVRLAFHVGPAVSVTLAGGRAHLAWRRRTGREGAATMVLPEQLSWRAVRAGPEPLGWYAPAFGRKVPITTLVGAGRFASALLRTELRLEPD